MTHGILLALTEGEAEVVRAVDAPGSGATVVRRCADLAELMGAVGAGIGSVAVLSSQVLGVDRASISRLVAAGARVLLVGPTADAARLAQLGAHGTATESDPPETVAAMAIALARGERVGPTVPPPAPSAPTVGEDEIDAAVRVLLGEDREQAGPGEAGPGGIAAEDAAGASSGPAGGEAGRPEVGRSPDQVRRRDLHRAAPGATTPPETDDADGEEVISEVPWWLNAGAPPPATRPTTAEAPPVDTAPVLTAPVDRAPVGATPEEADADVPPTYPVEPGAPGRVVVVWGTRGAPGRTTLALNLAAEAAGAGMGTVLVDADTEAPSLAQVLGLTDDISSIAAVTRTATHGRLDAAALRSALVRASDHLDVLTGLTRPDRWRELEDSSLEVVWDVLREVARVVVVDVGAGVDEHDGSDFSPARHQATLSALAAADEVVVVGAADPVGMRRLVLALTELRERELAPDARRTVVVNRVRRAAVGPDPALAVREALWRYAGDQDAHLVPDDPSGADGALLAGQTWRESAPGGPARRAVAELARHVLDLSAVDVPRRAWWRRAARAGAPRSG